MKDKLEKEEKPAIPLQAIEDAIGQINGDPHCKASGCHGKGYTGIRINMDSTRTLMLCHCGRWKETDYVRVMKQLEQMHQINLRLTGALLDSITKVQRRTLFGGIEYAWLRTKAKVQSIWKSLFKERKPAADAGATVPVPVTGEAVAN